MILHPYDNYKIERVDRLNLALFQKIDVGKKKGKEVKDDSDRWRPIRFYSTIEQCLNGTIEYLAVNDMDDEVLCLDVLRSLSRLMEGLGLIVKGLLAEMPEIGVAMRDVKYEREQKIRMVTGKKR